MNIEYLEFVIRNLSHRRLRAWLTVLGIVIGVAAIVSLVTFGEGMKESIAEQFQSLGINSIRVVPGDIRGPPSAEFTLPNDFVDKLQAMREVEYVDAIVLGYAAMSFDNEEKLISAVGYETKLGSKGFADVDVNLEEGRFFNVGEKNSIIIGHNIADKEFEKTLRIKNSVLINDQKFRIIGIMEKTGGDFDNRVYMPLTNARELFNRPDSVNAMVVKIKEGLDINEVAVKIEKNLKKSYDEDLFDVFTPAQILEQINAILSAVQIIVSGIAAISVVVGLVGITNSMFTAVLERTREIGIMKAIGAKNSDIMTIFLIESAIIGLVGGIIGIILGSGFAIIGAKIIEATGTLVVINIQYGVIGFSLLFSILIGLAAGAVPAYNAAKLKPVIALRYE